MVDLLVDLLVDDVIDIEYTRFDVSFVPDKVLGFCMQFARVQKYFISRLESNGVITVELQCTAHINQKLGTAKIGSGCIGLFN